MGRLKRPPEEETELNLAPIMNMVIILIPLLLLSVVFMEVAVINITAPKLATGAPSNPKPKKDEEKPLNLTVAVSAQGFRIAAQDAPLTAIGGCPQTGPTICLAKTEINPADKFRQAREVMAKQGIKQGEAPLNEGMKAYNWRELYNQLMKIKAKFPKETIINVTGDADIPFAMIVRVMDVARYKLEKDEYAKGKEGDFWKSTPRKKGEKTYEELFSDPVLALVK